MSFDVLDGTGRLLGTGEATVRLASNMDYMAPLPGEAERIAREIVKRTKIDQVRGILTARIEPPFPLQPAV